jgi:anaerobic magnesium-protoporphyrin IX monomethyl ester cyclase
LSIPRRLANSPLRPIRRVALVYSPIRAGTPLLSTLEKAQRRPGLGLRYLSAAFQREGIQADLYDNLYDSGAAAEVHGALNRGRYDLVCFHTTSASRTVALNTVRQLDPAQFAGRVLAGGPGSLHADELLAGGVDLVARGEGEDLVPRLVRAYQGTQPFEGIPGLRLIDEGGVLLDTGAPEVVDLTDLPMPDWSLHRPDYGDMFNVTMKRPYFVVMASRGCPFRCSFCASHQVWKRRYRARPIASVLDELDSLVHEHGARYVHFLDDVFAWQPGWLEAFCEGVAQRRLQLDFSVVLHPLSFRGYQHRALAMLRRAGCRLVSFGAQSAVARVLRAAGRSADEPAALERAARYGRQEGLATVFTYIFGLPGDTVDSIRETTAFACRVRPTLADFHPLLYLPGSEIADRMASERYCRLDDGTLNHLSFRASADFYLRHGGAARLMAWVMRHNPGWLRNLAPVGRWGLEFLTLVRDQRSTKHFL